jgi:hypothetical protein
MATQGRLTQIAATDDTKEKTEQYKKLLTELVAAAAEADINEYIEHSECARLALPHTLLGSASVCELVLLFGSSQATQIVIASRVGSHQPTRPAMQEG